MLESKFHKEQISEIRKGILDKKKGKCKMLILKYTKENNDQEIEIKDEDLLFIKDNCLKIYKIQQSVNIPYFCDKEIMKEYLQNGTRKGYIDVTTNALNKMRLFKN